MSRNILTRKHIEHHCFRRRVGFKKKQPIVATGVNYWCSRRLLLLIVRCSINCLSGGTDTANANLHE